jgi:DNA-binding IclR family transcriptional regulator
MPATKRAMAEEKPESGVQSVHVALDILEMIAFSQDEIGVSQIATRLGIGKGAAFRHLKTLAERSYVSQNPATARYRLGHQAYVVGRFAPTGVDLAAVAAPHLRALRDELGQSVVLTVPTEQGALVLTTVLGTSPVEIGVRPGSQLSYHASAQGQVIAAFSRRPLRERVGDGTLDAFTDHTITSYDALSREIERVKRRGWASAPQQTMLGLNAVAAPIFDDGPDCVGSVAIVGSIQFVPAEPAPAQVEALLRTARVISRSLGPVRAPAAPADFGLRQRHKGEAR